MVVFLLIPFKPTCKGHPQTDTYPCDHFACIWQSSSHWNRLKTIINAQRPCQPCVVSTLINLNSHLHRDLLPLFWEHIRISLRLVSLSSPVRPPEARQVAFSAHLLLPRPEAAAFPWAMRRTSPRSARRLQPRGQKSDPDSCDHSIPAQQTAAMQLGGLWFVTDITIAMGQWLFPNHSRLDTANNWATLRVCASLTSSLQYTPAASAEGSCQYI